MRSSAGAKRMHSDLTSELDWLLPFDGERLQSDSVFPSDLRPAIDAAITRLTEQFAAATSFHNADRWLSATASGPSGRLLLAQMLWAVITVDHYKSRIPAPCLSSRKWHQGLWRGYLNTRAEYVIARFPAAMMRWTVLARIPENWIVPETLFSSLRAHVSKWGFGEISFEGNLEPPYPGGTEWLRDECASELETVGIAHSGDVIAAVVFAEGGAGGAILDKSDQGLAAWVPASDPTLDRRWHNASPFAGVLLLDDCVCPPASFFLRVVRAVGLRSVAWAACRYWRRKRLRVR